MTARPDSPGRPADPGPSARRIESDADVQLLRRLSVPSGSGGARLVRTLVPLGDDLKPWFLVTPILASSGKSGRRALARGWVAIGLSAILSTLLERLVRRARPGRAALGERVRAGDEPSSSSFPSTHTSSAVAFAGAVTAAKPRTGWLVVPLAGFVAWSRPAGGRHYPSDVIGGALVGGIAAAAVSYASRWAPWLS